MDFSIALCAGERNTLLDYYRRHSDPSVRLRCQIILLLADGHPWSLMTAVLFCSTATIARWKTRFERQRVAGLLGLPRGPAPRWGAYWRALVVHWVLHKCPRDFGFLRSRWCCAVVALLLERWHQVRVSRETVRRWLQRQQVVWRRPRPILQREDPDKEAIVQKLRGLLLHLPEDETVVFEDEVDVNLNPKIGCMWMRQRAQAAVVTPGDNAKRYLAGSLHWRTGLLLTTAGDQRDGALFVRHLHDLRRRLRRYKKIHVICDNAKIHHDCWAVWEFYYKYGDRVVLHFLPKYAPELNPIERVWWILHDQITRNHQCQTLQELVDLVLAWLAGRKRFEIETPAYQLDAG